MSEVPNYSRYALREGLRRLPTLSPGGSKIILKAGELLYYILNPDDELVVCRF